jgi:hypothetical protein
MSFFQELQRRKVIRTVLAYGAAAFVAAQITQLLVDALGLSDWILKAVVVVAIVALPFVVGLAWVFDASRAGVQLTSDNTTETASAFPWRRLALPFAGSLLLLLAAFFYLRTPSSKPLNADLVAVLPFHISAIRRSRIYTKEWSICWRPSSPAKVVRARPIRAVL